MAAPVETYVTLPDDSGNTGKKIRAQSLSVSGNTVLAHAFFKVPRRNYLGHYVVHSGALVVAATAHTFGTSGFLWFANPLSNAPKIVIREIEMTSQLGSALATPTSPRLLWSTFTFTGTASGASLTPGKLDSTYAGSTASIRTAITGMTTVKVADMFSSFPIAGATAVGYTAASTDVWAADDDEYQLVLRAGEGICLWQADNGTTSDTRRITATIHYSEFD